MPTYGSSHSYSAVTAAEAYPTYLSTAVPVTLPSMTHFSDALQKRDAYQTDDAMSSYMNYPFIPGIDVSSPPQYEGSNPQVCPRSISRSRSLLLVVVAANESRRRRRLFRTHLITRQIAPSLVTSTRQRRSPCRALRAWASIERFSWFPLQSLLSFQRASGLGREGHTNYRGLRGRSVSLSRVYCISTGSMDGLG
jgi:hypothetical protein